MASAKLPGGTELVLQLQSVSAALEEQGAEDEADVLRDAARIVKQAAPDIDSARARSTAGYSYERQVLDILTANRPEFKSHVGLLGGRYRVDGFYRNREAYILEVKEMLTVNTFAHASLRLRRTAEELSGDLGKPVKGIIVTERASPRVLEEASRLVQEQPVLVL